MRIYDERPHKFHILQFNQEKKNEVNISKLSITNFMTNFKAVDSSNKHIRDS
jgi:hypothetical protein